MDEATSCTSASTRLVLLDRLPVSLQSVVKELSPALVIRAESSGLVNVQCSTPSEEVTECRRACKSCVHPGVWDQEVKVSAQSKVVAPLP